ncbi:MAG TPA: DUF177 domain-containing protein [Pyrinomonadaceae bacterium]|jgi:uncharacterized protein|nr:DUF177 domain-containing protein [Pyrinomonadaceae bacterium]
MQVDVENLSEAGEAFAHTYEPGELDLEDESARLISPAIVGGRASRKRDEVRLRGTIKTEVEMPCDRCLRSTRVPVEVEFDAGFIPAERERGATENVELQQEDLSVSVFEGETINIDELVREQILLALPIRLLCTEDCKGLCPHCGADLNAEQCSCDRKETDPRWAALAALKPDQD